jgi:hypothetical protein
MLNGIKGGIRVAVVEELGPSFGKLEVDDVIISIDGVGIASDGTVKLRGDERISYEYLLSRNPPGTNVEIKLIRRGQIHKVFVALEVPRYLVPRTACHDAFPSYFICGGLVFVPLTKPWSKEHKASHSIERYRAMERQRGQQVVIVNNVLAHKVNFGYHNLSQHRLGSFNGTPIYNLAQLKDLVENSVSDVFEFRFLRSLDGIEPSNGEVIVYLNAEQCRASESEIFSQHMIATRSLIVSSISD